MLFFPKMYQKDIHHINYDKLYDRGIRTLLFDLDNTIGLLEQKEADEKTKKLFKKLSKKFHLAIISNHASRKRVEKFAMGLNCISFHLAMKPGVHALKKAQTSFGSAPQEVCMIGDQLVTDILAANRLGYDSCLVDPLATKDLKITTLNRMIEKRILKKYEKKNIMKIGEYYE